MIIAVLALLCAGHAAWAQAVEHLPVGDLDRTYLLERFHAEQVQGRLPIIILLYGLGTLITEGVPPRFDIPFTTQPGIAPVLVVRPQGVDRRWDSIPGPINTWTRLAGTNGEQVDDIAFMRALIDRMVEHENGDPARVYVAGVSSGGFLVARIACEMGDKVAAVADVIATARAAVFEHCDSPPVPFALIASTTDDVNPYDGGGTGLARLASAPQTAFFFARHNGCTTRTETPLTHDASSPDSTVTLTRFAGCGDDAEVLSYRVDGSDHSVPSTAPIGPEGWDASGRRNRDMETAQVLWAFFQAHRR